MAILKPLKEFNTFKNSFSLIEPTSRKNGVRNLYKYMDLETAITCLKNGTIRFSQPSEWPDKYESHFYNADYSNVTSDTRVTPRIWACCFNTEKMSEASWNTYRYGKQGLGSRCVKFVLSRSKMRQALHSDRRFSNTFEGLMDYSLGDYDIQQLHLRRSPHYTSVFSRPFELVNYLSLLLVKRAAFNYENEFRFMVTSDVIDAKNELNIYVHVNWGDLIKNIEIDKDATDVEIDILKYYLKEAGVSIGIVNTVKRTTLYEDPIGKVKIE